MGRLLEDYVSYLKIERAMSPSTVASYSSDVRDFLSWTGSVGMQVGDVTSDDIVRYFGTLDTLSKRSQARCLSSLKSFFRWTVLEGYVKDNPCDAVDAPKIGRHLPAVLSEEEVGRIIASVDTGSWNGLRDRAILEVLYGCGLRVSEAVGLKMSMIYSKDGFVRIVGKGNKERLVPIGGMALEAVSEYLEVRPEPFDTASEDILFLNKDGRALSRVAVFTMVKRQAMLAGIHKEISPHTFRHSFATHLVNHGADLRVVQDMLGHESILTTEIYTHIDTESWMRDVISHHPRR
ncbi:MAG: site-specific tyrosine recombinase/integron integrase [Candidatus Cryptobacteroides sp.]